MIQIALGKGLYASIDDDDKSSIESYKWRASRRGNKWYATTTLYRPNCNPSVLYMHRVVMNASPSDPWIDHQDGNGLNNVKSNLRFASGSVNATNPTNIRTKINKCGAGFIGVQANSDNGWSAMISHENKRIFLGCYPTPEAAAIAYNEAASRLRGENTKLNVVDISLKLPANIAHEWARTRDMWVAHSKITIEDVREIRRRSDSGETHKSLAKEYGVTYENIRYIAKRITWTKVE